MEGLNKVLILGNLGADPELRTTQSGQSLLKLRVATSETFVDKNDTRQERTEWHQITLWGKRGEALAKFLQKGERIFVEGTLRTSTYEKDGEKRYRTEIVANNVILAGKKASSSTLPSEKSQPNEKSQPRNDNGKGARDDTPPDDYYSGGDDDIPF